MATLWSDPLEMDMHVVSAMSWSMSQALAHRSSTPKAKMERRSALFHDSVKSHSLGPIVHHPIQNSLTPWKQYICYFVTLYYEFSRHQPASGIQCLWNTQLGKPFRNKEILITTHTLKAPGRCLWHVRMINKLTAALAIRKLLGQITN